MLCDELSLVSLCTCYTLWLFGMCVDCSSTSQKIPRDSEQPIPLDSSPVLNKDLSKGILQLLDGSKHSNGIVLSKCSIQQKSKDGSCSSMQFEALVNLVDKSVCRCAESSITVSSPCAEKPSEVSSSKLPGGNSLPTQYSVLYDPNYDDVSIFAITPTYARLTQKVDMTSLCYNIQNIPNFIWIVIEDSKTKTNMVARLLDRCPVSYCRTCRFMVVQLFYFICWFGWLVLIHVLM